MKSTFCAILLLALSVVLCRAQSSGSKTDVTVSKLAKVDDRALTSYGATLYNIAKGHFSEQERRHQVWILAIHEWNGLMEPVKYTDGKHVVLSIPVLGFERQGMLLYVAHYNALIIGKADSLALDGKCNEALTIYRLVEHFQDPRSEFRHDLKPRIRCVEQLLRKEDVAANLTALKEMTVNNAPSPFESIESARTVFTTNLLHLRVESQTNTDR